MSDMIFMITLNRFLPTEWNHYTSAGLQISTLTSLSAQLGITTLILLQHRRIQHSRNKTRLLIELDTEIMDIYILVGLITQYNFLLVCV